MTAHPRNRAVVFRLNDEEYRMLQEACEYRGGRNLSEFTRSEVLEYLNAGALPGRVQLRFAALEQEIAGLKDAVARLAGLGTGTRVEPSVAVSAYDAADSRSDGCK